MNRCLFYSWKQLPITIFVYCRNADHVKPLTVSTYESCCVIMVLSQINRKSINKHQQTSLHFGAK